MTSYDMSSHIMPCFSVILSFYYILFHILSVVVCKFADIKQKKKNVKLWSWISKKALQNHFNFLSIKITSERYVKKICSRIDLDVNIKINSTANGCIVSIVKQFFFIIHFSPTIKFQLTSKKFLICTWNISATLQHGRKKLHQCYVPAEYRLFLFSMYFRI